MKLPQEKESTKQHIAAATARLISETGNSGVHVTDIAKCADVGVPTIYYHFGSRERLVAEAQVLNYASIVEAFGDCIVRAEAALDAKSREDYILAIGDKISQIWRATQENGSWSIVELLRDIWRISEIQKPFSEVVDRQVDRWASIIERGQGLNWIDPGVNAQALIVFCWSASLGQMIFSGSQLSGHSSEDIRQVVLSIICGGDNDPECLSDTEVVETHSREKTRAER
jgi:AcrR family transcriptional regulator